MRRPLPLTPTGSAGAGGKTPASTLEGGKLSSEQKYLKSELRHKRRTLIKEETAAAATGLQSIKAATAERAKSHKELKKAFPTVVGFFIFVDILCAVKPLVLAVLTPMK